MPGAGATRPTGIPAAGWKQVLKRARAQVKEDNVGLMAAGVAFYLFLALFPALIAAVTLYGLVADPQQVEEQIADLTDALPEDSASLITGQLQDITSTSSQALGPRPGDQRRRARCSPPAPVSRTWSRPSTSPTTSRRRAGRSGCGRWRCS